MKFAFAAAALLAATATPALAAPITYTFNGTFTGNRAGAGDFTIGATFTGKGDTANAVNGDFGVPGVTGLQLTSLSALAGGETFMIQTPATFFKYGTNLGLIFGRNTSNGFGFTSPTFELYDGLSTTATTAITPYYPLANFSTDKGQVTISAISGATFSSQVTAVSAAVPEPATWGMMILGFGVAGAAMRRRKSKVTTNVSFA